MRLTPTPHVKRLAWVALFVSMGSQAAEPTRAPNAHLRQFSVGLQRDAEQHQALLGLLSLPLGERGWLQFGGGRSRQALNDGPRDTTLASLGAGYLGDGWQLSLAASHRRAGERLRQTDWDGTLDRTGERYGLGLDLHHRDARQDGIATTTSPLSGTSQVAVRQHIRGHGLGLHGHLQLSDRFKVFGAAMRYDLHVSTEPVNGASAGPVSTLLGVSPSFVSHEELPLRSSARLGARWRFDTVSLSTETLVDRVEGDADTLRTVLLKAAVELGAGWTLTPSLGSTRSRQGRVGFGGLVASHGW